MKSTDKFQLTQVHNTLRGTGLGELVRMAVTYLLHNTLFSITFLFLRKLNPQGKHAVKCGSCNFFYSLLCLIYLMMRLYKYFTALKKWSKHLERWARYVVRCEIEYPGPIDTFTNFGKLDKVCKFTSS